MIDKRIFEEMDRDEQGWGMMKRNQRIRGTFALFETTRAKGGMNLLKNLPGITSCLQKSTYIFSNKALTHTYRLIECMYNIFAVFL